jgi:hypothetical protein
MYGAIAIGFAEVERIFSKTASSAIKEFITRTDDRIRKPYGRATEHTQRHFHFWGSTNDPHLLGDRTGSRRFPWVRHLKTDKEWIVENRERIFGTLYKLAKSDFRSHYNEEEIKVLNDEGRSLSADDELANDLYEGLETGVYVETHVGHAWSVVCGRTEEPDKSDLRHMQNLLATHPLLTKTGKRARKPAQYEGNSTWPNPMRIYALKESVPCAGVLVKEEKVVDRGI